jgi:hypothetical protein
MHVFSYSYNISGVTSPVSKTKICEGLSCSTDASLDVLTIFVLVGIQYSDDDDDDAEDVGIDIWSDWEVSEWRDSNDGDLDKSHCVVTLIIFSTTLVLLQVFDRENVLIYFFTDTLANTVIRQHRLYVLLSDVSGNTDYMRY